MFFPPPPPPPASPTVRRALRMTPKGVLGGPWHQMALNHIDSSRQKMIPFQFYFTFALDYNRMEGLVWC